LLEQFQEIQAFRQKCIRRQAGSPREGEPALFDRMSALGAVGVCLRA
jgi:hypothetical protein